MSGLMHRSQWQWLFLAFAFGVVAIVFRLAVNGIIEFRTVFLLMIPSVLAATLAGFWPCAIATCFIAAVSFYHLLHNGLTVVDVINTGIFLVLGFGIAWGGSRLRKAQTAIAGAMRDVAAREVYLRSILDTVPDALVVIGEDGTIRSFSVSAERLFRCQAGEAKGSAITTLLPGLHKRKLDRKPCDKQALHSPPVIRTMTGRRWDSTDFPAEVSVNEMTLEGQSFFTISVRDLTERYKTEERLRDLQTGLAHMSRVTALGEMASTLAHELNQPLAAIANYLNGARRLVLKTPDSDETAVSMALGRASEQALRAGQILRRVRDFVTRGEIDIAAVRVSEIVREGCMLALVGYGDDGPSVQYNFCEDADMVFADNVQIQQVIVNLMRNASEAMRDSAHRELVVITELSGDGMSMISVVDTGTGVVPDIAEQVFRPFVTTKPNGMGIGLSISKSIIEAHGGRIWAENVPGGGAAFRFTLRRVQEMAYAG